MGVFQSVAVFFVVWWLCLFVFLPLGVKSQREMGDVTPGTDGGAPYRPYLAAKALGTTILAVIIYGGFYLYFNVYHLGIIDLAR